MGKASTTAFLLLPLPLHPTFLSVHSPNNHLLKYVTSHSPDAGFPSPSNHIPTTLKWHLRPHMTPSLSPLSSLPYDIPPSTLVASLFALHRNYRMFCMARILFHEGEVYAQLPKAEGAIRRKAKAGKSNLTRNSLLRGHPDLGCHKTRRSPQPHLPSDLLL